MNSVNYGLLLGSSVALGFKDKPRQSHRRKEEKDRKRKLRQLFVIYI
jgi:hypothetical protein